MEGTPDSCPDLNILLNYVGGKLRKDFDCFSDDKKHEIEVHCMLCAQCADTVDRLKEALPQQVPWFRGCKAL